MKEQRKHERRFILYDARIRDRETGLTLGYLNDLTPEGAALLSDDFVEVGRVYQLTLDIPQSLALNASLNLEATIMWCRADSEGRFFEAGMRFSELTNTERTIIEKMIAEFSNRQD